MRLAYLLVFTLTALLSVVVGEDCGYVRGPLAATNDTVVINLDCQQWTPLSHYVALQVRDNATHVAIQLVHCHTVPVGLFTNVTDNLSSVTVASKDAFQLLNDTFKGLELVTELRLLGFTLLESIGHSVLEPLRNIQTLILDGFGRDNIELPYLGRVIRQLSGTPIRRVVLNRIKGNIFFQPIMQVYDFMISNASVKELIIADAPLNYEGSIHRAFPELVCLYASKGDAQRAATLPTFYELILMSDTLTEIVVYRPKDLPAVQAGSDLFSVSLKYIVPSILKTVYLYPDLLNYRRNRLTSEDCEIGFVLKLGAKLMKLTANGFSLHMKAKKPLCVEEGNNLVYLDLTGSRLPGTIAVMSGLKKLKYLSLENTRLKKVPSTFLQYYPALVVLNLGQVDIGNFVEDINGDFFGSCPTLEDIYLNGDNLTKIPTTTFSRSVNLRHLDISKNYLRTFDFDLRNSTKLNILNLSHNHITSINQKNIIQLSQLASGKLGSSYLVVDLSYNKLHCLCNFTHFIKWLQRSPADSNLKFHYFDSYTCLHPNGSIVRVSEVTVDEVEQRCSAVHTLANGSNCPCDEEQRRRLQQVWVHLEGFFCRNDAGVLVAMKHWPLPSCFNPYKRASFIAPVVVGGILGIAVFIAVGLLIYYRNTRHVRQVCECSEMNPARFVRAVRSSMS